MLVSTFANSLKNLMIEGDRNFQVLKKQPTRRQHKSLEKCKVNSNKNTMTIRDKFQTHGSKQRARDSPTASRPTNDGRNLLI